MPPPPECLWSGRWWGAEQPDSGSDRWLASPCRWGWRACSVESSGAWSLSTLALSGSERAGAGVLAILRYLDLVLLAVALPVFIAANWPMLGYGVAAAAWIVQRFLLAYATERTARSLASGDRRDAFRTTAISGLGRVWLVSVSALLVGLLAEREDGLAAALLLTALFTVQLATSAVTHRGGEPA